MALRGAVRRGETASRVRILPLWKRVVLGGIVALVCVSVLEGAARVMVWRRVGDISWLTYGSRETNSHGFRGREFDLRKSPGMVRVVTIGGSTTWGWKLPVDATYPFLLERRLQGMLGTRIEVINAGKSGLDSDGEKQVFLTKVLDLGADVVIVWSGYNDAWKVQLGVRRVYAEPSPNSIRRVWRAAMLFLLEHSVAGLVLTEKLASVVYGRVDVAPLRGDLLERELSNDREIEHYYVARFEENLDTLLRLARSRQISTFLVKGPLLFEAGQYPGEMARFVAAYRSILDMIDRKGMEHGSTIIDLVHAFDDVRDRRSYFIDYVHLNRAGNERIAETIASALLKKPGLLSGTGR